MKKKPIYPRFLLIALTVIILFFNIAGLVSKDKEYSPLENRNLQTRPAFSLHEIMSGRFESEYEDYLSDQFAFRGTWIRIKAMTDRLLGKTESNGVYLGKDGYLMQKFTAPSKADRKELTDAMTAFTQRHPEQNHYAIIAPTAALIHAKKLPKNAITDDQGAFIDTLSKEMTESGIQVVDVRPAITETAKEQQVYYRTDHHWTTQGAFAAYRTLAEKAGLSGADSGYEQKMVSDSFSGTLTASSGFRMGETDEMYVYLPKEQKYQLMVHYVEENLVSSSFYVTENLDKRDQYTLFFNGNHPLVSIKTSNSTGRKLLVFKDSYANCFVPFLAEDYSEIVMVDPRYYADDIDRLMQQRGFTDVLYLFNATSFAEGNGLKDVLTPAGNE